MKINEIIGNMGQPTKDIFENSLVRLEETQ